jgi:uncharacterized protein YlxP (DUF503 family)
MILGTLELHLRLKGCFSLKDKRQVLRSILDRVRRDFQVSASEVGDQDLWNVATIAIATVSNDAAHVERILTKVFEMIDSNPQVEIEATDRNIERR